MQQEETNPPTPEQIQLAAEVEAHCQAMLDGRINPHGPEGQKAWGEKLEKLKASCRASGTTLEGLFPEGGAVDGMFVSGGPA